MPSYEEKVYSEETYLEDFANGGVRIDGDTLVSTVGYSFNASSGYYPPTSGRNLRMLFPVGTTQYGKKRKLSTKVYLYIANKSYSGSGALPGGSFTYWLSWGASSFVAGTGPIDASISIPNFTNGQYIHANQCSPSQSGNTYTVFACPTCGCSVNVYANTNYNVSASITTSSHTGANPPYLLHTYEDVVPTISDLSPTSGFVDRTKAQTFRWRFGYNSSGVQEKIAQKKATFRWREKGSETVNEMVVEGAQSYIEVPANTFPAAKSFEWQLVLESDDAVASEPSAWMELSTQDAVSQAAAISPVNAFVDALSPTAFTWRHVIATNTSPTGFDLEYSQDGQAFSSLASLKTAQTSYTLPANTLQAGQGWWRVRTYNIDEVPGEYCTPASIVVRAAPQAPSITGVSQSGRPTIVWQSQGQLGYEVQILQGEKQIYHAGPLAGTEKEHKVTQFLPDGDYSVQVRIQNEFSLLSEWGGYPLVLETPKPAVPDFTLNGVENGVRVTLSALGQNDKVYLLRDGKPIHRFDAPVFDDFGCVGAHQYALRVVTGQDCFADSLPKSFAVTVNNATMAPIDDLSKMFHLKLTRSSAQALQMENTYNGAQTAFLGRRYPVYEFSKNQTESYSIAFSLRNPAQYRLLVDLLNQNKTLLYRDKRSNAIYGAAVSVSSQQDAVSTDFTITLLRVDANDAISYDEVTA